MPQKFERRHKKTRLRNWNRSRPGSTTSSPKGNDRSPESHQNILNSFKVKDFSIGQGQLTPHSMLETGQISNSSETI